MERAEATFEDTEVGLAACVERPQNAVLAKTSAVDILLGRYVIIGEIGRGAMGVVRRAYDPRLQREVALKSLQLEHLSTEAQAQMLQGAHLMAKLAHPNVVAVYDLAFSGNEAVLAMEYVEGTTLKAWLAQPRSWREIVSAFVAAGRGLAAAHSVGLLHADFKPAKVLVGNDGRIRVTGFGLTHVEEALDPAADQFAFCVALWEALSGEPPFAVTTERSLVVSDRAAPAWPRTALAVPSEIRSAITRGLAAEPSERWPSMDGLLDRLTAAPLQHHGRLAWIGGTAVAATLAAAAWGAYRQQLAERCSGSSMQLVGIWDDARRSRAQQAMLATGAAFADGVWKTIAPALDTYAEMWAASHHETCEATAVRGEQSVAIMDLKMACLHRARIGLKAATDLLVAADVQVAEKAHALVDGLPDLGRCADESALGAEVLPPKPDDRDDVEVARVALAEAKALREAGKFTEALARMKTLADEIATLSYRPLHAEVMLELGVAWQNVGVAQNAETSFKRALRLALSSRQWAEAQIAAVQLVGAVGWHQARTPEALGYAETARGLLGDEPDPEAAVFHTNVGGALEMAGRYTEAETGHRAALAIVQDVSDSERAHLGYRRNLGNNLRYQGRMKEAELELRADVDLHERVLGNEHPDTIAARLDLGNFLVTLGREEAEAELRLCVALAEKSLGHDALLTAFARAGLATLLSNTAREEQAELEYRAALRALTEALGPGHFSVAALRANLGSMLTDMGRYGEGEAELRMALDELAKLGPGGHSWGQIQSHLVNNLLRQQRYDEAEGEARKAVAYYEQVDSELLMGMHQAYANLGRVLSARERAAEAEVELRKALSMAQKIFGDDHIEAAKIRVHLGATLEDQGRYQEAESELRAATSLLESLGPDHPHLATARARLEAVVRAQG